MKIKVCKFCHYTLKKFRLQNSRFMIIQKGGTKAKKMEEDDDDNFFGNNILDNNQSYISVEQVRYLRILFF